VVLAGQDKPWKALPGVSIRVTHLAGPVVVESTPEPSLKVAETMQAVRDVQ
jgi:hypothetical protein